MCRTYRIRIAALAERAGRARSGFLPPEEPPDRDRALEYLRDGVGPSVALYQEASINGAETLSPPESRRLDHVFGEWIELYAACYGVFFDVEVSVAEAATLLGDGRSLRETARRLTGVPEGPADGRQSPSNVRVGTRTRSEHG